MQRMCTNFCMKALYLSLVDIMTLVLSKTLEIAKEWNRECWISQFSTLQKVNSEPL
jgi:hypothetical protein